MTLIVRACNYQMPVDKSFEAHPSWSLNKISEFCNAQYFLSKQSKHNH
jgi:hypothetical protein